MRRSRLGLLMVLLAVSGAACNGPTSADPTPAPSPTAAAASPSPSPAPSPSPSPTEVLPANDVDDPVAALEAIVAYRDWLFENPDPDKLALIYAERCDCYEQIHSLLDRAASDGSRLRFERARVFEPVEVTKRDGPVAELRFMTDEPSAVELDRNGRESDRLEGNSDLAEEKVILVREGGRWRVLAYV